MPDISEADLAALRFNTDLLSDMLKDPEARELVLKGKKKVRPNDPPGPYEVAASEAAKWQEQLEAVKKQLSDDKAEREREKQIADLRASWDTQKAKLRRDGYTEEGISGIEALAQERGVVDLEAAAALFDRLHPPQAPATPSNFGSWDFFNPEQGETNDYVKKLFDSRGNDDQVAMNEARKTLQELRGQPRR